MAGESLVFRPQSTRNTPTPATLKKLAAATSEASLVGVTSYLLENYELPARPQIDAPNDGKIMTSTTELKRALLTSSRLLEQAPSESGSVSSTVLFEGTRMPAVLAFESWWTEDAAKRTMRIDFHTAQRVFGVKVDDAPKPVPIVITGRNGRRLKPWDLYVGASIDVLGRQTILKAASCETVAWIDRQARDLLRTRAKLEEQLYKFRDVRFTKLQYESKRYPVEPKGGTFVLRPLIGEVKKLYGELALFRGEPDPFAGNSSGEEGPPPAAPPALPPPA
eukprot:tig00020554_g10871.t1